ncbi:MAG: NifB/NifX family molybdenum-iron cluster-binding protein [Rhodocyclaceae bacterium]|nr:NifB/NifX family molybdenum-iron cluster-binding protein [Rhodocyclaceae bacterium]
MLRVAFASVSRSRVDQHFGAAEAFAIYDIGADRSALVAVGEFPEEAMDGRHSESRLAAKVDFLAGCAAVFVLAIGASAIKQLMAQGIQPLRVNDTDGIPELIREVSTAMKAGGLPWVDRALAQQAKSASAERFEQMENEGWQG